MLLSDARVDVNIKCKRGIPTVTYGYNHAVKSLLSGKRVFGSYPVPVPVPVPAPPPPLPAAVKAASATLAPAAVTVTPVVPAVPVALTPAEPRSLLPTVAPSVTPTVAAPVAPDVPINVPAQSVPPPPARSHAGPEPTRVVEPNKIVKSDATLKTAEQDVSVGVKETNTNKEDPVLVSPAADMMEASSPKSDTGASTALNTSTTSTNSATSTFTAPGYDNSVMTAPSDSSWLASILLSEGYATEIVQDCEQRLVTKEGFLREQDFASLDTSDFNRAYLKKIGIVGLGIQSRLLGLQQELCVKYTHSGAHEDGKADGVQAELEKLRVQCEAQRKLLEDTGIFDPVYCE